MQFQRDFSFRSSSGGPRGSSGSSGAKTALGEGSPAQRGVSHLACHPPASTSPPHSLTLTLGCQLVSTSAEHKGPSSSFPPHGVFSAQDVVGGGAGVETLQDSPALRKSSKLAVNIWKHQGWKLPFLFFLLVNDVLQKTGFP